MNKKKLSVIYSCFAVIALALSFHSCDLDEGGPSAQMFGFGTLREIDKSQEFYYVILDYEDKSLYLNKCPIPVDARNSGQRVAVTFEPLEYKVDGFDYNGNIQTFHGDRRGRIGHHRLGRSEHDQLLHI